MQSKSTAFGITLDLDGEKVRVLQPWGRPLPPIVYNNKTGIFYQLTRGYTYCQVDGKVLSNIEVADDAAD